jgi:hypothetical protein
MRRTGGTARRVSLLNENWEIHNMRAVVALFVITVFVLSLLASIALFLFQMGVFGE